MPARKIKAPKLHKGWKLLGGILDQKTGKEVQFLARTKAGKITSRALYISWGRAGVYTEPVRSHGLIDDII
jgi:hypothetical protein